jgi:hypothetical protein
MKHAIAILALAATACGAETALPQAQDEAPRNTREIPIPSERVSEKPPFKDTVWSLRADSLASLPECTPETEGRLA